MSIPKELLEDIKETLLAGRYSLFLGAGASFGGMDRSGKPLPSSDGLREHLVALKGIKANSSLARAYNQLTLGEVDTEITERFSNCKPGPAMMSLPKFIWKRIYSLNVDDSILEAYRKVRGHQTLDNKTHKSPFSSPPEIETLEAIHIHGWTGKPDDGYVFSLAEYVQAMGTNSPWTTVLAHSIATEPFIIAGTSLEEPDLEYFLAGRHKESVRRDRGPSFLIEPYPDSATIKECERHGLNLYQGTFEDFLGELEKAFPTRPLPSNASTQLLPSFFTIRPSAKELAQFLLDFSHVTAQQIPDNADLSFYVGREPTIADISLDRDISRKSTLSVKSFVQERLRQKKWEANFLLLDDNAGSGKSTVISRLAYDLAAEGHLVFQYKSVSTPNLEVSAKIFNGLAQPFILFCDDFADHVSAISELYRKINREDFLIIGSERSYRIDYVEQSLVGNHIEKLTLEPFNASEAQELIAKMEGHGLTSYRAGQLSSLASDLTKDPIAIAVCRIIQDFKPIEKIIESLVNDADSERTSRYLACALASYCYRVGVAYPILVAAFPDKGLEQQLKERDILPLSYSDPDTKDYLIPTNPMLGQRILREISKDDESQILEVYSALGGHLVSYVNRTTIMKRTPEARLAGRLFDYDDVVTQFLPKKSEAFFLSMKKYWGWNSRYWEQFALLKLDHFHRSSEKIDLTCCVRPYHTLNTP